MPKLTSRFAEMDADVAAAKSPREIVEALGSGASVSVVHSFASATLAVTIGPTTCAKILAFTRDRARIFDELIMEKLIECAKNAIEQRRQESM